MIPSCANSLNEQNQQTDKESWFCSWSSSGAAGGHHPEKNAAKADQDHGRLFTPSPQQREETEECVQREAGSGPMQDGEISEIIPAGSHLPKERDPEFVIIIVNHY